MCGTGTAAVSPIHKSYARRPSPIGIPSLTVKQRFRGKFIDAVAELKSAELMSDLPRSHNSLARCRGRGRRRRAGSPGFYMRLRCDAGVQVTCRKCKALMREIKGHIYHQRKWQCPKCVKVRMQKQKGKFGS